MKIGIMGGTFDPVHNGHLALAGCAYDNFNLDEVWFLPNGNPPHKSGKTDENRRLEMVELAIRQDGRFRLNSYETDRQSKSYSYETLEYMRTHYPEYKFFFIIGADSLFSIESWKEPARVLASCTILAACRDDKEPEDMQRQIRYLTDKYNARIRLLRAPHMDISSSDIRRMVSRGLNIDSLVPEGVSDYIREHHLYQTEQTGA